MQARNQTPASKLLAGAIAFFTVWITFSYFAVTSQAEVKFVNKLIESEKNGYGYAYGPSIIYDGSFHMFYCSSSVGHTGELDSMRYSTSPDGRSWSTPKVMLTVTGGFSEGAACDPSIVRYKASGDSQPYYYLFYSGNNGETAVFVARSTSIDGPYAKWTTTHTWTVDATNPQPVIVPQVNDGGKSYGAGEQTVVATDTGLKAWWGDSTNPTGKMSYATTTSPTSWPKATDINVGWEIEAGDKPASVDVKYDPSIKKFRMFYINGNGTENPASLRERSSTDGITWSSPTTLCKTESGCMPEYAHNPGISGDASGNLINGRGLIVYGAPTYGCSGACGQWDLTGTALNPAGKVWNEIPAGWRWYGMTSESKLALGDYDGDGKTDRVIVNQTASDSYWYGLFSGGGTAPFPWGWKWGSMGSSERIVQADYDGDGKTDRAMVDQEPSFAKWYCICSSGTSPFSWGAEWAGMTPNHKLALGDYDGDGKTDRVIVDQTASDSYWYGLFSGGGTAPFPWGWKWGSMGSSERIAQGDYDGDGKTDRAMVDQEPSFAKWYCLCSSGTSSFPWGAEWSGMTPTHKLALGDYDGDGKTDRAIVDLYTENAHWYGLFTGGGSEPFPWGWEWSKVGTNAKVAIGDYDGDGKDDTALIAFPNSSYAQWFIYPSAPFKIY